MVSLFIVEQCLFELKRLHCLDLLFMGSYFTSACSECAYTAATKGMVQKHVQAVHRKEKPYECDICQTRLVKFCALEIWNDGMI